MRPTPPTSVTVLGILQIVFGCLGLVCGVCAGVASRGGQPAFMQPQDGGAGQNADAQKQQQWLEDMQKAIEEHSPANAMVGRVSLALDFLVSALMIASGIGMLRLASWGRLLGIVYALLSMAMKVFGAAYGLIYVVPAGREFLERQPPPGANSQLVATSARIGLYAPTAMLVLIIYPVIVLIIMFRPRVVAAFQAMERHSRGQADLSFSSELDTPPRLREF